MDVCGKYELSEMAPSETDGFYRYLYVRHEGERSYSLNLVIPTGLQMPKHLEVTGFGVGMSFGVLTVKS